MVPPAGHNNRWGEVQFYGNRAEGFQHIDSGMHGSSDEPRVDRIWTTEFHYLGNNAPFLHTLVVTTLAKRRDALDAG